MLIANKYKVIERLGSGSFGNIYKATNIRTKEQVALKMESLTTDTKLLKNETKIYQYLNGIEGIPRVLWFGVYEKNYYMAITLLGDSLNALRQKSSNPFSLECTIFLTIKMLNIIESIHSKGLIHRDIKPDNFLFDIDGKYETLYLIDFGFCKKYTLYDGITHIPLRQGRSLIGTPNFVSINVHDGLEPSRRDDLESLAYIMLHLSRETLEWTKMTNNDNIKREKMIIMTDENTPKVIREFFTYCRSLKFDETPDYDHIRKLLTE